STHCSSPGNLTPDCPVYDQVDAYPQPSLGKLYIEWCSSATYDCDPSNPAQYTYYQLRPGPLGSGYVNPQESFEVAIKEISHPNSTDGCWAVYIHDQNVMPNGGTTVCLAG